MSLERHGGVVEPAAPVERYKRPEKPPFSQELIERGRATEAIYEAEFGFLPEDHQVTRDVQALLDAYPGMDKPTRIRISLDDSQPDAFVLPNGTIVINRGLLSILDTQELQVVIAHETTHYRERHVEEFQALQERLQTGQATNNDVLRLVGSMRLGEYQADIQGIIEGDEAGTHPGALRTLMHKLEAWKREYTPNTDPGLVHGREIQRIVNAGIATQVYDFEASYAVRTPLSQAIIDFCASPKAPRFPETGECEAVEAEQAFVDKKPLDLLICLRNWRLGDQALLEPKDDDKSTSGEPEENLSMSIIGEGYAVAFALLEKRIQELIPEATPFQQKALRHILVEAVAGIPAADLEDSDFASVIDYLDDLETPETVEAVHQMMSPEIFQRLGVVLPNGNGLSRVLGSILGAANQSEIYVDEDGKFSVDAYLTGAKQFFAGIHDLLAHHSLVGAQGFILSEAILEELFLNLDTRKTTSPVVESALRFQQMLIEAGLPPQAGHIHHTIKQQKCFERLQNEETLKVVEMYESNYLLDRLYLELYRNAHPILAKTRITHLGYFAGSELFKDNSYLNFNDSYEEGLTAYNVSHREVFDSYFEFNPQPLFPNEAHGSWMSRTMKAFGKVKKDPEEARNPRSALLREIFQKMQFSTFLKTPEDVISFVEGVNRLHEECTAAQTHGLHFERILFFTFIYLLYEAKQLEWLPEEDGERRLVILRLLARMPGTVTSAFLMDSNFQISFTEGIAGRSHLALKAARIILGEESTSDESSDHLANPRHRPTRRGPKGDSLDICVRAIQETILTELGLSQLDRQRVLELNRDMDRLVFRYSRVFPGTNEFLGYESHNSRYVDAILDRFVKNLQDPEDQELLLSLSSRIEDPLLRSRIVEKLVVLRLEDPNVSVEQGIDFLFRNGHVKPTLLKDVRDQFIDERVDTPASLEYLRKAVIRGIEDVSTEQIGVYALLEKLEKRLDTFTIFKACYEYSSSDLKLKEEVFGVVRQDWQDSSVDVWSDEEALLKTEAVLQGLEQSGELIKHALVRKLLIGEQGLLHGPEKRRKLFEYLLNSAVDTKSASTELISTVKEALEVIADTVETDVLFFALAPFLQERLLMTPNIRGSWEDVLMKRYNGDKKTVKNTLTQIENIRQGKPARTRNGDKIHNLAEYHYRQTLTKLGFASVDATSFHSTAALPSLEAMIVRVAESLGADGVRFVQVLGQYVPDLSPELEEALRNANDNVRGQPKLTAYETSRRRAPGLKVARMGKRLGGGSLMSPYDSEIEVEEGKSQRVALKVLAPNAEFISDTVETELRKVVDVLVERNPNKYTPAKQALEDISTWIRADVNDRRFFELDPGFRDAHGGFQVPGFRYVMYVPTSVEVPGGSVANKYLKAEEFVEGITLNRLLADPQGHDLKQAVSLIAKSFAQQLVRGVMHSDVHPGNYMIGRKDNQDCLAMIDRNFYLELNQQDQTLVFQLTQESAAASERIQALKEYFAEDDRAKRQDPAFWANLEQQFETAGERGISVVTAHLRSIGVVIPLKFTLLLKNIHSLDRLARRVGFGSFREALGYLPAA